MMNFIPNFEEYLNEGVVDERNKRIPEFKKMLTNIVPNDGDLWAEVDHKFQSGLWVEIEKLLDPDNIKTYHDGGRSDQLHLSIVGYIKCVAGGFSPPSTLAPRIRAYAKEILQDENYLNNGYEASDDLKEGLVYLSEITERDLNDMSLALAVDCY